MSVEGDYALRQKIEDTGVIPRDAFLRGTVRIRDYGGGRCLRMEDSWFESDKTVFAVASESCAKCRGSIGKGQLMNMGRRLLMPDAPVPLSGVDHVHFTCDGGKHSDLRDPSELDGYGDLSLEQKAEVLKLCGVEATPERLAKGKRNLLAGMVAILNGAFTSGPSKEGCEWMLRDAGVQVEEWGRCNPNLCVYGGSGKARYGRVTGRGSKKYREIRSCRAIKWVGSVHLSEYLQRMKNGEEVGIAEYDDEPEAPKAPAAEDDNDDSDDSDDSSDDDSNSESDGEPPAKKQRQGDYAKMSYRELQAECKAAGLRAVGTADALRARLKA